jgi:RNA polymerase sigma-70 factor, ECF subfamily
MRERDVTATNLTAEFERQRPHLQAVAYRMLGSATEAEDAVQEAWLRLRRSDTDAIANLGGWLTTVVARVCLDLLRTRRARREDYVGTWLPEPVVTVDDSPEDEAVLADSVGLALLVVLDTLTPAERLAFVLHDMFAFPFDEIATILGRSEEAARQLASRARRRVRGATPQTDLDLREQRPVVDAFLSAARDGDFQALVEVLHPDVVFRVDIGPRGRRRPVVGAQRVAKTVLARGSSFAPHARPAIVNGNGGAIVMPRGKPVAVVGFTVEGGRIVEIDIIANAAKLSHLTSE